MNEHPYGEKVLNKNPPPKSASGLILKQFIRKVNYTPFPFTKNRYFIIRTEVGTCDQKCATGELKGVYQADMGYWHFATKEARDAGFQRLIERGYYKDDA